MTRQSESSDRLKLRTQSGQKARLVIAGLIAARRFLPLAALLFLSYGCTSTTELTQIQAQLADLQLQTLQIQKQVASKEELTQLGAAIEAQIRSLTESQADLKIDVGQLARQIEQLETKLEETNFRLAQLWQQIDSTNRELQAMRVTAEEMKQSRSSQQPEQRQPPPIAADPSDPKAIYDTAYGDYLAGNYDLAILGFSRFLEKFPDTELADNSTYWLGECFYLQNKFNKAIEQFDAVLTRFGSSDRAASALLKKGYAFLELGQRAQGIVQLQNVACEFTGTDEAHLAEKRLKELGIDVSC